MASVAIQGVKGSYSEEAVNRLFAADPIIVECETFEEAFEVLDAGVAEYLVVPVHNKIVGDIETPKDLIKNGGYKQLDSITIEVRHVLAGAKGAEIKSINSVYSHIEALKQCRKFLNSFPALKQYAAGDTALSICNVVRNGAKNEAAIGSKRAAEIYGAEILLENIADDRENRTTFNLITK